MREWRGVFPDRFRPRFRQSNASGRLGTHRDRKTRGFQVKTVALETHRLVADTGDRWSSTHGRIILKRGPAGSLF